MCPATQYQGRQVLGGYRAVGFHGFVSLSEMSTIRQTQQYPSAVSLPRSLLTSVGMPTESLVLLAEGSASQTGFFSSPGWVLLRAPSCRAEPMASLSPFNHPQPCFVPTCSPLGEDLSSVPVCWVGNPLLSYSCLNCWNFKGISLAAILLMLLKKYNSQTLLSYVY